MGLFDDLDKATAPISKGTVQNSSSGLFDQLDELSRQQQQIEKIRAQQAAQVAQVKKAQAPKYVAPKLTSQKSLAQAMTQFNNNKTVAPVSTPGMFNLNRGLNLGGNSAPTGSVFNEKQPTVAPTLQQAMAKQAVQQQIERENQIKAQQAAQQPVSNTDDKFVSKDEARQDARNAAILMAAKNGDVDAQNQLRVLAFGKGALDSFTFGLANSKYAEQATPGLARINTGLNQAAQEYPKAEFLGGIVGSLPSMAIGGGALAGSKAATEWAGENVGRKLAVQAASGALDTGTYTAAGQIVPIASGQETPQEAVQNIGSGALGGAVLGGALGGLGEAIGSKAAKAAKLAEDAANKNPITAPEVNAERTVPISEAKSLTPEQELEVYKEAIKANPEKAAANGWDKQVEQLNNQIKGVTEPIAETAKTTTPTAEAADNLAAAAKAPEVAKPVISPKISNTLKAMTDDFDPKSEDIAAKKNAIVDMAVKYAKGDATPDDVMNFYDDFYKNTKEVPQDLDDDVKAAKQYLRGKRIYSGSDLSGENGFSNKEGTGSRAFFGKGMYLTKDPNAASIDQHYLEANEMYPEIFPKDITNPADQAEKFLEVASRKGGTVSARDLNPYHQDNFVENFNKIVDEIKPSEEVPTDNSDFVDITNGWDGVPEVGEAGAQAVQKAMQNVPNENILGEVQKQFDALPIEKQKVLMPNGAEELNKLINGVKNDENGFITMPEIKGGAGQKINDILGDKANAIEKLDNGAIKSDAVNSPVANVQRYRAATTISDNAFHSGVISNGKRITQSFQRLANPNIKITDAQAKELFNGVENDTKQFRNNPFEYYAYLTHNVDRLAEEKPVLPLTVEQSKEKISLMDKISPKFKQALKEYSDSYDKFMQTHAVGKTMSAEDYATFKKKYPNYVPTFRDFGENSKGLTPPSGFGLHKSSGNVMRTATGSTRDLKPLAQNLQTRMRQVVKVETRNDLYRSIIATALKDPQGAGKVVRVLSAEPEEVTTALKDAVKNGDEVVGLDRIGSRVFQVNGQKVHTITAMINGKPVTAQVAPKIFEALEFLDNPKDIGKGAQILKTMTSTPMRLLKATATEYNPTFMVTNGLRDLSTACMQSVVSPAKFVGYYAKAVKGMATHSSEYLDFLSLGGRSSTLYNSVGINELTPGKLALKILYAPFKGISKASEAVETAPRFAEYLATVDKGGGTYASKLQGIHNAAEVTTNFSRTTPVLQTIDAFVPYFNASQQGLNKFLNVVKAHPIRTALRGAAVITAPTAILYGINNSNPNYRNLDTYVKDNYFCIPNYNGKKDENGNPETFIKWPKDRQYGLLLSNTFNWIADSIQGNPPSANEVLTAVENILPSNPLTQNIASPAANFVAGASGNNDVRNWNGSRIIPQSEAGRVLPKDQYDATTSGIAKGLGKVTNISPRLWDYLGSSYGGGYSNGIKGVTSNTQNPNTKNPINSMIINKFTTDSVYSNNADDKFYNALDQWEQQAGSDKKNSSPNYSNSHANYLTLSRYNTAISDLLKQAKAAEVKGDMPTARTLRKQIISLENTAVKQVNN